MTFNAIVPLSTQSPGLFPAQNNTNYTRLKTLISGDHIFNDTAPGATPNNDGTHKQVTVTFRADPAALPTDTNGIMFSKLDATVSNAAQLYWYNGSTIEQMTGQSLVLTGKASLTSLDTTMAFPNPGYNYTAMGWIAVQSTNARYILQLIMRQGAGLPGKRIKEIVFEDGSGLTFGYSGEDLKIKNNSSGTLNIIWNLNVTRLIP